METGSAVSWENQKLCHFKGTSKSQFLVFTVDCLLQLIKDIYCKYNMQWKEEKGILWMLSV